jgi:hypothetical protein
MGINRSIGDTGIVCDGCGHTIWVNAYDYCDIDGVDYQNDQDLMDNICKGYHGWFQVGEKLFCTGSVECIQKWQKET